MRICLDNMVMNFLKYQSILLYKEKNPVINKLTRVGNQFFLQWTESVSAQWSCWIHTCIHMYVCIYVLSLLIKESAKNLSDERRSYRYNNTMV